MNTHEQEQEPPFCVQVELSEGCNLFCDFCGLQGIREKPGNFKFMTLETAELLALMLRVNGWNSRVEFAMHGEPTMNPDYIKIVRVFRKHLPKNQLMMMSNGGGLLRPPGVVESLNELFDAGLNVFAFDAYEHVKIKDKVDAALRSPGELPLPFDVHHYPDQLEFSPHDRYPRSARKFIRVRDIRMSKKGTHTTLNNHCGSGAPGLKEPIKSRCAKPFRELSIRWDGSVAICCNDWRGVYKIGNINKTPLNALWNSAEFQSARRFLMVRDRGALKPCNVCDAWSYQVGLLPDRLGKKKMRAPNEEDRRIVEKAARGSTLTEVVVRPWEIKKSKRG